MKQTDLIFYYPQMLCVTVMTSLQTNSPVDFDLAKRAIVNLLNKIPINEEDLEHINQLSSPLISYLIGCDIRFPDFKSSNKKIYYQTITDIVNSIFDFASLNYHNLDDKARNTLRIIYCDRFPTFGPRELPNPVTESYKIYNSWDKLTPLIQLSDEEPVNLIENKELPKFTSKTKSYDNQKNKKS